MNKISGPAERSILHRLAPALTLVLIAPFIAEYLSGSVPVVEIASFVAIAPIYGFGCLLIRELARQTGRGWPTIIALGAAYGAIEEGVATISLFDPNFLGYRFLDYGHIASLGMGSFFTVLIISLHVVWSVCLPIGLIELTFAERRTQPWLKKGGLMLSGLFYILGVGLIAMYFLKTFVAQPFQYAIAISIALICIAIAFFAFRPERPLARLSGQAPKAWVIWAISFAGTSLAFIIWMFGVAWHIPATLATTTILAMDVAALLYIFASARREGWSNLHRLALVAGPLLTYSWVSFVKLVPSHGLKIIPIQASLIAAFIVLLILVARKLRRAELDRA